MKKFLALLLVAVLALTLAGAALASDSDGGHVIPPAPVEPTPDASEGAEDATPEVVPDIITVAPVEVVVLNVEVANIVTAEDIKEPVAETVVQAIVEGISQIVAALQNLGLNITFTSADIKDETNLQVNESESYADEQEAIEQAAAKLENDPSVQGQTAVGALPRGMSVRETGPQPVSLPRFAPALYGKRPSIHMFPRGGQSGGRSISIAATTEGDAIFLDSTGAIVDVIPDLNNANGANPGELTAIVHMEEGQTYDPVISVPTAQVTDDPVLSTQIERIEVREQVVVGVKEVMSTSTFTNDVPDYVISALNEAQGLTYRVPSNTECGEGWSYEASDLAYMASNDYHPDYKLVSVNTVPTLSLDAGNYVFGIIFDSKEITPSDALYDDSFEFYANEVADGKDDEVLVFDCDVDGNITKITPADVKSGKYTSGYMAFSLSSEGVITAAKTELKPSLFVKVEVEGASPTPVVPVSSGGGGGCSAGFSALTLAVLGGLFALRRKQ